MIIAGLTGSIGMGKSTAARYLRQKGVPVFDADQAVHALYEGKAAPLIEATFPGTTREGAVDRAKLAERVLGDREALAKLESLVHPLVREEEGAFLRQANEAGHKLAVLEIPLLFETANLACFDATILVSAPAHLQRERVLSRQGMTDKKLKAILSRQHSDAQKRKLADFVVDTSGSLEDTFAQIDAVIAHCLARKSEAFTRWQQHHQHAGAVRDHAAGTGSGHRNDGA